MAELTPMMKQYFDIKSQYPDTILMFRLGDFYEMFFEDAKTASRELELVLTGRDCGQEERAPMCGVPFHSVDSYIARLVARGYKVAICEQTEDPALAKGLVSREVIRVLTPGTVIESSMLDEGRNNFLASVYFGSKEAGICFADISTGTVKLTRVEGKNSAAKTVDELAASMPSEILLSPSAAGENILRTFFTEKSNASVETAEEALFDFDTCRAAVDRRFGAGYSEAAGFAGYGCAVRALGAALIYLEQTQKSDLATITEVDFYGDAQLMKLDVTARRNLELCRTMRGGEKRGSLLWVLDKTMTPMGKRMLAEFIEHPLVSLPKILRRQNAVAELFDENVTRRDLRELLGCIRDMERPAARAVYGTINPKELRAMGETLVRIPPVRAGVAPCKSALLREIYEGIDPLTDVAELIENTLADEPPFSVREGGIIRDGVNEELDSLRALVSDGKGFLASIEASEQEKTGIKKLKIGYNRVFGYYIEVSNSYRELVPDNYIRKQTLANCERFITQELKELEAKVLGAQERIAALEYELYTALRVKVSEKEPRIAKTAANVALLDVLCSLAEAAVANNYCCPELVDGDALEITDGRHPVVELMLSGAPFVPNDTLLDCGGNRCMIITGPNMAGKSTYMRQVALIVLMAQIGSFVPAKSARLGVVDSIFTRIGASDDLSAGQSTFMVEMTEVAAILSNATPKSLIIFDEIGRGTSTFDGMSIAQAVLEYSADRKKLGAKTLFATHYHELTDLEGQIDGVKNYNTSVKKRGDDITFLRRIIRGVADGSYGIEVAGLAGVPHAVLSRAKVILASLERHDGSAPAARNVSAPAEQAAQLSFGAGAANALTKILKDIDVNTLTPIEALGMLDSLSREAKAI